MISKYRYSLIAVIMLVLVGFGFQNQAKGQPEKGSLCPLFTATTGYTDLELGDPAGAGHLPATFSAGVLGTVEADGGALVAGMDWMHESFFFLDDFRHNFGFESLGDLGRFGKLPTNITGSQHVAPWIQDPPLGGSRTTYVQLTNSAPDDEVPVQVHVQIFDTACQEIANWCDDYTGFDTHEYNFGDIVANDGQIIGPVTGEGFVVMTPVKNCDSTNPDFPETAIDYNHFAGEFMIHDELIGPNGTPEYRYGAHTYARQSICVPPKKCCLDGLELNRRGECVEARQCEVEEGLDCPQEGEDGCGGPFIPNLLAAYTCQERVVPDEPEGVCLPNPTIQGSQCALGFPVLDFCGAGGESLPDGECVEGGGSPIFGMCLIQEFCETDAFGRGCLTGSEFARYERVRPDNLFGQFNVLPANNTAGADLILINFFDSYVPYTILPGFVSLGKNIHNDLEERISCGNDEVCYARFGIDAPIVISEDFSPPPTMGPTATATATPTMGPTATPTPTSTRRGGKGSSTCNIAGPVQLGTAMANVLIPLVPVAFAFGVRAVRRRKK